MAKPASQPATAPAPATIAKGIESWKLKPEIAIAVQGASAAHTVTTELLRMAEPSSLQVKATWRRTKTSAT